MRPAEALYVINFLSLDKKDSNEKREVASKQKKAYNYWTKCTTVAWLPW